MTEDNQEQLPEAESPERGTTPPKQEDKPPVEPAATPEHLEELEREGEDRQPAEGEDVIAPYDLVPGQYAELATEYHAMATEMARDAQIPAAEAEIMLHLTLGGAMEAVSPDLGAALAPGQVPGVDLSNKSACLSYLNRKYGATEASMIVERARAEFAKLPKKWQDRLDHNDGTNQLLTNSPHLLLALAMRNMGWTRQSKEAAKAELEKLNAKGKLSAFDLEKRRVLGHIISRGQSADNKRLTAALAEKKAKPVAPTVKSKLEAELRTIRMDRGYLDKSAPNHRALQARVAAIYAELHPEDRR